MAYEINRRIKELRKSLKLSQAAFGERLGVGIGVIKNIEYANVDPKAPFLSLLCEVFSVNHDWLIHGIGDKFIYETPNSSAIDRIKSIRYYVGLSQTQFAESLGLGRGTVKGWEEGTTIPSETAMRHLCDIYNINYLWLTDGTGEMFLERDSADEIAEFLASIVNDDDESIKKRLIRTLSKFDSDDWKTVEKFFDSFT